MAAMAAQNSFVHLRVHSEYSVSEGAARLSPKNKNDDDTVVRRAAELEMPALGLADLGNIFGAVKFFESCRGFGVKPVIGCETPLSGGEDGGAHHLLLLCADAGGYRNLNRLLTRAYDGNGGRVNPEWLRGEDNRGLLALSGGVRGEIGIALKRGDEKRAAAAAGKWAECFGDRFYVEAWRAAEDDDGAAAAASAVAAKINAPLVATHPVQCARAEDLQTLEIRRCIAHNWLLGADNRDRPFADPPYLLDAAEMRRRFADMPDALENSADIARRCNFAYPPPRPHLPKMDIPGGKSAADILAQTAREGLQKRGVPPGEEERYAERLQYELDIITGMGYADYYLIVADFVGWARGRGIPVGPGRGSGAGSLVAYSIGITELDPIFHGLLFERFLNPERVSLPDFDIDFCVDGRDRVIEYVAEKYGAERVSQIVTFGQIGARSAVRDVGRVLGYPYSLCDRVARAIPGTPDMTIDRALEESAQLRDESESNGEVRDLLALSRKVEGLPRNIGTHAGGVLIAPEPIVNYCPLYAAADTNSMVSQMDMADIEKIGLVKFDFLGLKTLTILARAEEMLREIGALPEEFSLEKIPTDDAKAYEIYGRGELKGVFQCESRGMCEMMRRVKPDRFGDIVALIALYRPGPMQFMDEFIDGKHGRRRITYPHPALEESLAETYGVWVYQEQVMETARRVAGYSLGEADLLRRAMGKKKPDEMKQQRDRFVRGAEKTMRRADAEQLFDKLARFAEYGFPKAHAAAYALVSYRTAYFKAHYPAALYAAAMSVAGNDRDVKEFAVRARMDGVRLLQPDVNEGRRDFYLNDGGEIVYGLKALKGVGGAFISDIRNANEDGGRPFTSIFDFCRRLSGERMATQLATEHLIFAGAFDRLHKNRAAVFETLPAAREDAARPGDGLFGENALSDTPPWDMRQKLIHEQKSLGFALSGSFYKLYEEFLRDIAPRPAALADADSSGGGFRMAGILGGVIAPRALRKLGRKLLLLEDDGTPEFEISADNAVVDALGKLKEGRELLIVEGDFVRGRPRASGVWTLENFIAARARKITARCDRRADARALCETLSPAKDADGRCEIVLEYEDDNLRCDLSLGDKWRPGALLCDRLRAHAARVKVEYRSADS